jgi:hypothetical protein
MSRFFEVAKREGLQFDYNLYDAVRLDNNLYALITDFGVYDNQYWCEVCFPKGVKLSEGSYFSSNPEFSCTQIIEKLSEDKKQHVLKEYVKALSEYSEQYKNHIEEISKMIKN